MTSDELMAKYPFLYGMANQPNSGYHKLHGLEVGDGWLPLIDELSAKLETEIHKYIVETSDNQNYPRAVQVKEKFSTLRYYMSSYTAEIETLIARAEAKSGKICEVCGKPGKLRNGGWMVTLCNKHAKQENKLP